MTTTLGNDASPRLTLADPTIGFRRRSGAIALPAAFACALVAHVIDAVTTAGGVGDNGTGAQTLAFYATHSQPITVRDVLSLVGMLLVVPGLLAALRVLRATKPRLALVAVVLMIAGYIEAFGYITSSIQTIVLAQANVPAGAALDAVSNNPVIAVFFNVFVVGDVIGTLLLGLAVILSRELPWYAGALILAWPVAHATGDVTGGSEWFSVAGTALEVIGLSIVAVHALRLSNAAWAARG
jgi:hypothetical protein